MLCSTCLAPLELSFTRKRIMRHTAEDGPTAELITVCLEDGRYSTIFPDDIVKGKQYCISDIRSVLENKEDFSLASPRTRAYWKAWFRRVWDAVVLKIQLRIGGLLSDNDMSVALFAFCKECDDAWLRYVLDIFYTESNTLCMFFGLTPIPIMKIGSCKQLPIQSYSCSYSYYYFSFPFSLFAFCIDLLGGHHQIQVDLTGSGRHATAPVFQNLGMYLTKDTNLIPTQLNCSATSFNEPVVTIKGGEAILLT